MIAVSLPLLWIVVAAPGWGQAANPVRIDLDQAIQLALTHNHAVKAARTQIPQSQAEEVTAGLRPNPVFTWDALFLPIFSPGQLNSSYLNNITEFDAGVSYTIERGKKRPARLRAAHDQTAVVRDQISDEERNLTFNVAQQFIGVLLAQSTLDFARENLASFAKTVETSQTRYKAGAISEGDLLKIKLQLLQFQTDLSNAQLLLAQAKVGLRQLLGYETVPADYAVVGKLEYAPLHLNQEDLQLLALKHRPDLMAAQDGITAAQSQYKLAKANGKRDLTTSASYTRVGGANNASMLFNIEIPIFDRNQGEIARSHYAITQSEENERAAQETVMTDVADAYQTVTANDQIMHVYESGYLQQARTSLDISQYAYTRGAASLLDFLDAERSYRSTQLAYRQTLAAYMLSLEQLREAVGTRNLP